MEGILESILFVVGEDGISLDKTKDILQIDDQKLKSLLYNLEKIYSDNSRGLKLVIFGDKIKLTTKAENKKYIEKLIDIEDDSLLSQASLEVLAIIAYNQPITRIAVDEIRGINSSHLVRKLLSKNLIKDVGRSDAPGRPILYEVTNDFLDHFGLKSVKDLPELKIEEVEEVETDLYESKYKENN